MNIPPALSIVWDLTRGARADRRLGSESQLRCHLPRVRAPGFKSLRYKVGDDHWPFSKLSIELTILTEPFKYSNFSRFLFILHYLESQKIFSRWISATRTSSSSSCSAPPRTPPMTATSSCTTSSSGEHYSAPAVLTDLCSIYFSFVRQFLFFL